MRFIWQKIQMVEFCAYCSCNNNHSLMLWHRPKWQRIWIIHYNIQWKEEVFRKRLYCPIEIGLNHAGMEKFSKSTIDALRTLELESILLNRIFCSCFFPYFFWQLLLTIDDFLTWMYSRGSRSVIIPYFSFCHWYVNWSGLNCLLRFKMEHDFYTLLQIQDLAIADASNEDLSSSPFISLMLCPQIIEMGAISVAFFSG